MAFIKIPNVKITGMAAAVPKEKDEVINSKCFLPGEVEKVIALTGVKERRLAPEGRICSDYCLVAAEKLIKELDWGKESIDLLVYVSVTRDYNEPNTSTVIQGKLGLPTACATFDVPMACSGYCYGLSVVGSYLALGQWKRALLLVGDTQSKLTSPLDKTLWPLLGDAGTATALEYDASAPPMFFNLMSDGDNANVIYAPASGEREKVSKDSFEMIEVEPGIVRNRTHIIMDGVAVLTFALTQIAKCVNALCATYGIDLQSVDYLLLHQANRYIDEKIRYKLKMPEEKVPYCLDEYGNTSSGTIPLNMISRISRQLSTGKNKLMMSGFGAGLSWGAVYMETDSINILPVIEI